MKGDGSLALQSFGMLCRVSCLFEANLLNVARKTDRNNHHSHPPPLPGSAHF